MIEEALTGVEEEDLPLALDPLVHDAHHEELGSEVEGKDEDEDKDY